MNRNPKWQRWSKIIGVAAVVIGNTAKILSSGGSIDKALSSYFGGAATDYIRYTILVVLISGYLVSLFWLYRYLASRHYRHLAWVLPVVLCTLVAVTGVFNIKFIFINYDGAWRASLADWQTTLLAAQVPPLYPQTGGGIRTITRDPSSTPDSLGTAQSIMALLAYANEQRKPLQPEQHVALIEAFTFIDKRKSRDSASAGSDKSLLNNAVMAPPTTCTPGGWSWVPRSPWVTEVTSWVTLARIKAVQSGAVWNDPSQRQAELNKIVCDVMALAPRQNENGGWSPISYASTDNVRTYATMLAVWTLAEALREPLVTARLFPTQVELLRGKLDSGAAWLVNHGQGGGWVPNPGHPARDKSYPGLSGQVLYVLSRAAPLSAALRADHRYLQVREDFVNDSRIGVQRFSDDAQIFAEDAYFGMPDGTVVSLEAMRLLWFPWSALAYKTLAQDSTLPGDVRRIATHKLHRLLMRYAEAHDQVDSEETFVLAENLFCESYVFSANAGGPPQSRP
jgi:hypothetical protein